MNDETVPGTSAEDPVVMLGSGILGSTPFERHTSRYGTVHLTVMDSIPGEPAPARTIPVPPDEDLTARILHDLARADARYADAATAASENAARRPDNRIVGFDRAPLGATGTLVARVIAVDPRFDHSDDSIPELRTPPPGERVVLGTGTLFTEEYMGAPVIGVRPDDGRDEDWMDSHAITRCRDHLVRLEFEMPADSAPSAAAARPVQAATQEGDLPQPAVRTSQPGFPVANPLTPPRHAASGPASRTRAVKTAAPAEAPRKRGR
jgi:hypothetical protein